MARQSASANASKSKKPSSAKARASAPAGRKAPLRGKAAAAEEARLLDELRTRHDIVGVVFAVLARRPSGGRRAAHRRHRHVVSVDRPAPDLGPGRLPAAVSALGLSGRAFLVRFDRAAGSRPRGGGAGLGLLCRAGPAGALHAHARPARPFGRSSTTSSWPHVAATWARAWPGWGSLCSARWFRASSWPASSWRGSTVVGFSLSKLIERVREKRAEREGEDVLDAPPFARVRRGQDLAAEGGDAALVKPAHPLADAAAATKALPRTGERRRPRRASAPLGASGVAAAAGTAAPTAAFEPLPPLEGEPAPLTRKLGRKHAGEGVEKEKPAARPRGKKADACGRPGRGAGRLRGAAPVHAGRERGLAQGQGHGFRTCRRPPPACRKRWKASASSPRWWAGVAPPHGDALQGRPARRRAREPHHGARAGHRARALLRRACASSPPSPARTTSG